MKVGLFINTQFPEGFNLAECVPELVEQVRAARDAGFASLWFPQRGLSCSAISCACSRHAVGKPTCNRVAALIDIGS